ncbi:MAG: Spy0128 family protein [Otoolea sp.]
MKMSKKIRAIASAALISAMVMSMNGMTALADANKTEVPVKKTVTTDGYTYKPEHRFVFEITASNKENEKTAEGYVVYTGNDVPSGGLSIKDPAAFEFSNADIASPSAAYEQTGALLVNEGAFDHPGIYHYVLKEKNTGYEGVSYDGTSYDVYVYIEQNANKTNYVEKVTGVTTGTDAQGNPITVKTNLDFTNHYGDESNPDDIRKVTITKEVSGNQGNRNKPFNFYITVTGTTGEKYFIEYPNVNTGATESLTITSGNRTDAISLKSGDSIVVYGLSATDKVKVDEDDYSGDGYTTTYITSNMSKASDEQTLIVKDVNSAGVLAEDYIVGCVKDDNAVITVKNEKQVNPATGIVMTFGPYALLLALAGVFAVMFLRKKREDF